MVIIDCERLKFKNSGIYHVCRNLTEAILRKAAEEEMDITVFLRKKDKGIFGDDCRYMTYSSLYKYVFPYWKIKDAVWHTTFQYPRVMPAGKKTILTIHDLNYMYEDIPEHLKMSLQARVQAAIDKAACLVTISEYTKNDILKNLDTGGKPLKVIHNGCTAYSGPVEEPAYKPSRDFIFTIGAVIPKKNFHTLPCLLEDNGMELVIAGSGSDGYGKKIMEEARVSGVQDRVHMTGSIPESHKQWYLKNCTAFVFPSIAEGFGLPVVEAMYYGKPTFLSCHTSLPEIGKDFAFYFNPGFDKELMKAEFRRGMETARSGRFRPEEVKAHAMSFSWDKAASEYIKLYAEMAGM